MPTKPTATTSKRPRTKAAAPSRAKGKARSGAAPKTSSKKPFDSRESLAKFVKGSYEEYIADYKMQRKRYMEALDEVDEELRGITGKKPVALVEYRGIVMSSLKQLQSNYTRFLESLDKRTGALSDLAPGSGNGGVVININLPDWGAVPVVQTNPPPPEAREALEKAGMNPPPAPEDDPDA